MQDRIFGTTSGLDDLMKLFPVNGYGAAQTAAGEAQLQEI